MEYRIWCRAKQAIATRIIRSTCGSNTGDYNPAVEYCRKALRLPEEMLDGMETAMPSNLDLLSDAVMRLERENLRLKKVGMGLLILIGAALVMGQSRSTKTVEADTFILKGPDGITRAKLDTKDGSAELLFYNRAGYSRIAVTSSDEGEAIEMRNDSGELVATIAVALQKPSTTSPTTSTIAVLGSSGGGVIMQASKESTVLKIVDKRGHRVWTTPSQP
jgi:hypothetical protein